MGLISISEAAKRLEVSIDTLRRWDKRGVLMAIRSTSGIRHFRQEEIEKLIQRTQSIHSGKRHFKIYKDDYRNGFRVVGLFAGAGGTALGLENAGFDHALLSEIDKDAVQTLTDNRPDWPVVPGDVAGLTFDDYKDVDVLEGGFPCQAFSYAGKGGGFADTRGTLFFEFVRAIRESMPKVFVGENVRGLVRHDKGRTLSTMIAELKSIKRAGVSYNLSYRILRSQYFGVPQKRERLFIIGVRSDIGENIYFPTELNHIVTLFDAIGDRPQGPGAKYPPSKSQVLELVPPGGYWKDLPLDIQKEYLGKSFYLSGGKTGMARRLSWDEPSLTLTCSPAQKQTERCHPEETRPLNTREYARIQTFPDDWAFAGGVGSVYRQIGNAVPVNMGYFIGKSLEATLRQSTNFPGGDFVELIDKTELI